MGQSKHHITSESKGIARAEYRSEEVAPGIHVPYVIPTTEAGVPISVQHPLEVDGDSVYEKDIDTTNSDIGDFTGAVIDLFNDYTSSNVAAAVGSGGANPKSFTIRLKRPVISSTLGIGSPDTSLSNGKLSLYGLNGVFIEELDLTADNTKRGVMLFQFAQTVFIEAVVEFHTDDEVTVGGIFIPKSRHTTIGGIDGLIPAETSTTTPLAGDATYTSRIVDTKNYGIIVCSAFADVASATDGMIIEFSTDRVNWRWADKYTIAANTGKTFSVQPQAQYLRFRYINGSSPQTVFDFQAQLKPVYIKPSSHRIIDSLSGEDDAELVKAILSGRNPQGTYVNFQATTVGNFKMSLEEYDETFINNPLPVTDFNFEVAQGNNAAVTGVNKFGVAINGVQATATDIWDRADASATQQIWLAPTAARIHTIYSTSDVDSGPGGAVAEGAGCKTLRVWYLPDWNTSETYEDVVMDGTDGVVMINAAVIIHRKKCLTYGASGPNVGNIRAQAAVDATNTAQITAGKGQTLMAIFGIPTGLSGYISDFYVNLHDTANPVQASQIDFELLVCEDPENYPTVFITKHTGGCIVSGNSNFREPFNPEKVIPGPAIIKIQATGSAADLYVSAGFNLKVK